MAKKDQLSINYAYQKSVSFSQYQWFLAYVKKQKVFKPGIHLLYGTSLHEALQEFLRLMYDESIKAAEEMGLSEYFQQRMLENYKNDLEQNKSEHYCTKEDFKEFIEDGVASLEWFKKHRSKYFSKEGNQISRYRDSNSTANYRLLTKRPSSGIHRFYPVQRERRLLHDIRYQDKHKRLDR
jgi:Lhr-like helicase